ncbi:MAG: hypothetical protein JWL58_7282 [Streptosporangiaceae bacterium]|jgi:hypothetical protein|nr:hypothetical protein [Streptosporangiaceae bacterium]
MGDLTLDIIFATLSLVSHDASLRAPRLEEEIEDEVRTFFVEHIQALQTMSRKSDSPPHGRFVDVEAQSLFQALHMGNAPEFLNSAGTLTKRLIGRMNRSTNRGLLACVRAEGDSGRIGAALKLEIVSPTGTTLEELASGEIRLASVTNVLDQPGDLQKGALVASGMPAEEVVCGDTLTYQSRYFPEAFGIQVFARPSHGPSAFLKAVAQSDTQLAGPVAAALPQVKPGTLREVVGEIGEHVPAFDMGTQAGVIDALEHIPRPIAHLDTSKRVTAVIEQGDVTIKGPAPVIHEAVQLRERPDGTWEAVISFDREPKIIYR